MLDPELDAVAKKMASLDREAARDLIYQYEAWTDTKLARGEITREMAWDSYFGLLHECDERMMWSDRERILGKIDTKQYNPLLSKNPCVLMIARIRAAGNKSRNN